MNYEDDYNDDTDYYHDSDNDITVRAFNARVNSTKNKDLYILSI